MQRGVLVLGVDANASLKEHYTQGPPRVRMHVRGYGCTRIRLRGDPLCLSISSNYSSESFISFSGLEIDSNL